MQRCAFCQGELDPATLICRACGRVQPPGDEDITLVPPARAQGAQVRRCPQCDALLPAAARFCGRCGRALPLLAEETAGKALHDTGKPPEVGRRDEAITNALKQPVKLVDMPTGTPADTPKVALAAGRAEGSASRRYDLDTRQRPGGVAHGLRYRLLSRMQARIITTALVALLVIGGTAYSQAGLSLSPNLSSGIPAATAQVATSTAAAPTPTSTPTPTPTPGPVTPGVTPTPGPATPGVTPTPAVTPTAASSATSEGGASGPVGTLVARIVLLISIIGIVILLMLLGVLFFRRPRARPSV
jgi:hypothetical protein